VSRREQAKDDRRGRIVEAACSLLREVGVEALSMKAVASRADVSLSTVYNLFTSKQAVLAVVFDRDLETFQQLVEAAPSSDPLQRIFDSIEIAASLYLADPQFYRATMLSWNGGGGDRFLDVALRQPRNRFWRKMISDAVEGGHLKPRADPDVLGALAVQIFGGVLSEWISGEISLERLKMEISFGFATALAPFATPLDAKWLFEMVSDLHDELSEMRRQDEAAA